MNSKYKITSPARHTDKNRTNSKTLVLLTQSSVAVALLCQEHDRAVVFRRTSKHWYLSCGLSANDTKNGKRLVRKLCIPRILPLDIMPSLHDHSK